MTVETLTAGLVSGLATGWTKFDKVLLFSLGVLAVLFLASPSQAGSSLVFIGRAILSILPFLLLAVVIAAGAKASGADKQIARVFSGHPAKTITAAALFGGLSPFCSCGVIPVIAGLLGAGVPVAPVMAFWVASPLMNPEIFFLTAAELGLPFALARLITAVGLGLAAGTATHFLIKRDWLKASLKVITFGSIGTDSCCNTPADNELVWAFWKRPERRARFQAEAMATGLFLLKWLSLAFLIESLMVAWLPAEVIGAWLSEAGWLAIPTSVVIGVPAYLNGYAAIPLVSRLVQLGLSHGAALAFLTAGAVTSIPAAMSVFALVRPPLFIWYVAIGLIGSLMIGLGFQMVWG